jgi:capsular exopolysaccharide synthesis family protein
LVRFRSKAQAERRDGDLSDRLVTLLDPSGVASEAYRTLRTSLLYALVDAPPKVVVVTSPGSAEGKSTTCANLAVVLAQAGKNTLVIDCDLRKPSVHKIFGLRNFTGVVDALAKELDLREIWHEPLANLKVVTTGSIPPNPAELVGSRRFAQILGRMRDEFDYVIIDSPPVGLVSDPMVLATQGDGVLLVLDSQHTRRGSLRQAVRALESVGAKILGTVMNNAKAEKGGYYYGYVYGSGQDR